MSNLWLTPWAQNILAQNTGLAFRVVALNDLYQLNTATSPVITQVAGSISTSGYGPITFWSIATPTGGISLDTIKSSLPASTNTTTSAMTTSTTGTGTSTGTSASTTTTVAKPFGGGQMWYATGDVAVPIYMDYTTSGQINTGNANGIVPTSVLVLFVNANAQYSYPVPNSSWKWSFDDTYSNSAGYSLSAAFSVLYVPNKNQITGTNQLPCSLLGDICVPGLSTQTFSGFAFSASAVSINATTGTTRVYAAVYQQYLSMLISPTSTMVTQIPGSGSYGTTATVSGTTIYQSPYSIASNTQERYTTTSGQSATVTALFKQVSLYANPDCLLGTNSVLGVCRTTPYSNFTILNAKTSGSSAALTAQLPGAIVDPVYFFADALQPTQVSQCCAQAGIVSTLTGTVPGTMTTVIVSSATVGSSGSAIATPNPNQLNCGMYVGPNGTGMASTSACGQFMTMTAGQAALQDPNWNYYASLNPGQFDVFMAAACSAYANAASTTTTTSTGATVTSPSTLPPITPIACGCLNPPATYSSSLSTQVNQLIASQPYCYSPNCLASGYMSNAMLQMMASTKAAATGTTSTTAAGTTSTPCAATLTNCLSIAGNLPGTTMPPTSLMQLATTTTTGMTNAATLIGLLQSVLNCVLGISNSITTTNTSSNTGSQTDTTTNTGGTTSSSNSGTTATGASGATGTATGSTTSNISGTSGSTSTGSGTLSTATTPTTAASTTSSSTSSLFKVMAIIGGVVLLLILIALLAAPHHPRVVMNPSMNPYGPPPGMAVQGGGGYGGMAMPMPMQGAPSPMVYMPQYSR